MTQRSCAFCTKRHEVAAQTLGGAAAMGVGVTLPARLECRARPPVQGLARDAIYPTVTAEHYCHGDFAVDAGAHAAFHKAAREAAALDEKVAATQAATQAAAEQPALPLAEPEPAPEPEPATPKRARRARAEAE